MRTLGNVRDYEKALYMASGLALRYDAAMEATTDPFDQCFTRASGLNPYSCTLCRKKKRKCDRAYPCQNCQKTGSTCIFKSRKASTRPRAQMNAMERLSELERTIGKLKRELEAHSSPESQSSADHVGSSVHGHEAGSGDEAEKESAEMVDLESHIGKLAIADGKSRYIVNNFWGNTEGLLDKLEHLEDLLAAEPPRAFLEPPGATPSNTMTNMSFIFGSIPGSYDVSRPRAPPKNMSIYWKLYKENCDPLIKILHIPTIEPLIAVNDGKIKMCKLEPLVFAICFSAVVSLNPPECLRIFGQCKADMIMHFKFEMERALSRADLLITEQIMVLQAFAIYLTGLRNHCEVRMMWTLTALAVRLAQNAGLHRDGLHFKLKPFEVEMRRRLWWAICVLDSRASEDSGYEVAVPPYGVDTQLPLHVNDSVLYAEMEKFPATQTGCTEMTFSMVRYEAMKIFSRLQRTTIGNSAVINTKTESIQKCEKRLQDVYLDHLDTSLSFDWYVVAASKIVSLKMWLLAYHPLLHGEAECDPELDIVRDNLFVSAVECVDIWIQLNTSCRTSRWRWLCETYIQWHALTYLLLELCKRTEGDEVDQAWHTVQIGLKLALRLSALSNKETLDEGDLQLSTAPAQSPEFKPLSRVFRVARQIRMQTGHPVCNELSFLMDSNLVEQSNAVAISTSIEEYQALDDSIPMMAVQKDMPYETPQLHLTSALHPLVLQNLYQGLEYPGSVSQSIVDQADLLPALSEDWIFPENNHYL